MPNCMYVIDKLFRMIVNRTASSDFWENMLRDHENTVKLDKQS